jgi:SAM-dependent methyltransferase
MKRSLEPELLDRETPPPEMLARVTGYLRFVNRRLGGLGPFLRFFGRIREPVTVLDVGAGSGDLVRDLAARLPHVRPVALDRSEAMLALGDRGVARVRGDAFRLPFADRGVDYVISNLFLHHLSDDEAAAALRECGRVARRGIVVNDLRRAWGGYVWIRVLTLWANPYVKVDGPLSVRRAFTPEEAEALARRAGLGWLRVERQPFYRWTLSGERP